MFNFLIVFFIAQISPNKNPIIPFACLPEIPEFYQQTYISFYLILEISKGKEGLEINPIRTRDFLSKEFKNICECEEFSGMLKPGQTLILIIFWRHGIGWMDGIIIFEKERIPIQISKN